MIKAVIFDLDGTLANTGRDVTAAVNHARESLGLKKMTVSEVISCVGRGVWELVEKTILKDVKAPLDEARKLIIDYYSEHLLDETVAYPGIYALLQALGDDYKLAVATNKPVEHSKIIIKGLGMEKVFLVVAGPETTGAGKPDPAMLKYISKKIGSHPEEIMMVGDSPVDISAAKSFGCKSCAVAWGFNTFEMLTSCKPDYFIHSPMDLKEILNSNI